MALKGYGVLKGRPIDTMFEKSFRVIMGEMSRVIVNSEN